MTTACDVLDSEPQRFVDYILSDPSLRNKIYDKESFDAALRSILLSDQSLQNIVDSIDSSGESIGMCGQAIFELKDIQDIIKNNVERKRTQYRDRVREQRPELSGKAFEKEVERRIKILKGTQARRIKQIKEIDIEKSFETVRVSSYKRDGQEIKKYQKTAPRSLSTQERMLIENNIKAGKTPSDVIDAYYGAGFEFRTKTSIRRHYYRIKKEL